MCSVLRYLPPDNSRRGRQFPELTWNPRAFSPIHPGTRDVSSPPHSNQTASMWTRPPVDTVLHVLLLVASAAQAMTAALAAGRRSMDWVGVCLLGCVTALGGGSLRDVPLRHYPLVWVENPTYLAITVAAALVTVMIARVVHRLHLAFLVLDA